MAVVVFGSINMDLVVRTPRLPGPGETLLGGGFFTAPGGKGANQAVAAARAGATTRMVGRVGGDVFGAALRDGLRANGVDVAGVHTDASAASGVALIQVDDAGENTIVVAPGTNGALGADDLARLEQALAGATVLLLQLEVPLEAVVAAAQLARQRGVVVVLDPAPARPLPAELYPLVDLITPNEHEAAALVGFPVAGPDDAPRAVRELLARGAHGAVVKLGGRGACWSNGGPPLMLPPFPVAPVDTVAAGDAFNGALAAALSAGLPLPEALRWGAAAGALAVTRAGAQPALPRREELLALLESAP
ncbi:MAG TPA: ribokinase [Roseiflexaceae bacterium]|nr:ribokinase [Roseiflexaceae bacterium]